MGNDEDSIQSRFVAYDEAHPDIYCEFKRIAYRLLKRGISHYGAKAIFEIVRYHRAVSGRVWKSHSSSITSIPVATCAS